MSFWSGETLRQRLPTILGTFYDPKRIDCAAYRLCIGEEAYISPREGEDSNRSKIKLKPGEAFTIPAGQFAFLVTDEIIEIPTNALGFISVRAKIKFKGLINISGFHVDPGYRGRLIFSVFNASQAAVHLQQGKEAFLLWLCDLDRDSKEVRKPGDGYFDLPVEIINPISGEVQSLAGLAKKISDTERELSDKITSIENDVEKRIHVVQRDHLLLKAGIGTLIALMMIIAGRMIFLWIEGREDSEDRPIPISAPAPTSQPPEPIHPPNSLRPETRPQGRGR